MDPAEWTQLGKTRLQVTRVGLGTAPLGGLYSSVAEEQAVETVRHAFDAGLRFFDTAPLYGHGLAEHRIGLALRRVRPGRFALATKVGCLLRADAPRDESQLSGGFDRWPAAPAVNPVFRLLVRRRPPLCGGEPCAARARTRRRAPHSRP